MASEFKSSEQDKASSIPAAPGQRAPADWEKGSSKQESFTMAPAPEWTRYIDSRFKHFCTR